MQNRMHLRLILHDNITKCEFTKKVYIYEIFYNKIYNILICSGLIFVIEC
jgi:hypothetical protein